MLYIVGTPIGNLDDLSIRASRILMSVQIILAEDTRAAHTLLHKANEIFQSSEGNNAIETENVSDRSVHVPATHTPQIISYYQEVEFQKLPEVIEWLKEGKDVALVSQAGMPVISDPGFLLVQTARKHNLSITVIPGPSSVDTALVASGMKFDHFHFVGFLSKKTNEKKKLFNKLHQVSQILHGEHIIYVAFESPERIAQTLEEIRSDYPTILLTVCRELTKKFEEVIVNPEAKTYKGEIVLLLSFV